MSVSDINIMIRWLMVDGVISVISRGHNVVPPLDLFALDVNMTPYLWIPRTYSYLFVLDISKSY
jgi:hypothetical protein